MDFIVGRGIFEIVWATLLKFTDGFTKVWPSVETWLSPLNQMSTNSGEVQCVLE